MEENNNFLSKSNSFFNKHWILTTFFLKLSSLWFSLCLTFWGEKLNLIYMQNNAKQLTWIGWIATAIIVIVSCYIAIVERYYQLNNDAKKLEAQNALLNVMNSSVNDICKKKLSKQYKKLNTFVIIMIRYLLFIQNLVSKLK